MQHNMKSTFKLSGLTTYFDVEDHVIEVWMSSFSGKEIVRVDGRVVSEKRSWRYSTTHEFTVDGAQFRVIIQLISLFKGQARIDLYRGDAYLDHDEIDWGAAFNKGKKSTPLQTFLVMTVSLVAGLAFGYFSVSFIKMLMGANGAA